MKHDRTWARPMPWMAVGLVTLMPWSVGCQQWSLRDSTAKWFGTNADDDDWAPPTDVTYNLDERTAYEVEKRSSGEDAPKSKRVGAGWWAGNRNAGEPPPRVILPKAREAQKKAAEESAAQALAKRLKEQANAAASATGSESQASSSSVATKAEAPKIDPAAPKSDAAKAAPAGSGPASSTPAPAAVASPTAKPDAAGSNPTAAIDTGLADVDVEGAINALPAPYRDVIRKRIAETTPAKGTSETPKVAAVATSPAAAEPVKPETASPQGVASAEFQSQPKGTSTAPVMVRLGSTDSDTSSVVTTSHVESRGATSGPRLSWHQHASLAIQELEAQLAKDPPSDPALRHSQEMTLRMLYVTQRRLDDALRPIGSLTEQEQQFVQQEIQALYEASDPDANPARARHWSQVMTHHREANHALAEMANLEVKQLAFCDEVSGYGILQRCKQNRFAPDQDVLLYCEIDNVTAERIKDGYVTQLQGNYEIYDAQKRKVTEQLLPMEPELCQNQRRDYYIVYRIFMPQQIQSGRHELVLTIEDMKGRKFGQATAEFEIKR